MNPDFLSEEQRRKHDVPIWTSILIGVIIYIGILWLVGLFDSPSSSQYYPDDYEQWCGPGGSPC